MHTASKLFVAAEKKYFLKQYRESRQLLDKALPLDRTPRFLVNVNLLLAHLDLVEQDWDSVLARANLILQHEPDNLNALRLRLDYWNYVSDKPQDATDCRRVLEIKPDCETHRRLLFQLNFIPETTPESLYAESRRWNDRYARPLESAIVRHANVPDVNRRLKIGYLSTDFRNHAIIKLLPAVLEGHTSKRFEVFAYSVNTREDQFTRYVRSWVKNFVELPLSKDAIVKRVRADGIDILVDLAGQSMMSESYLAFAEKPAPVQVSWMGTLATTGLSTMDYFLGDAHMPCPGTDEYFSEKVYRLDRVHCCYRPMADFPLAPSPYFVNGYLTFGSFNGPKKITREMAKIWAVILHLHAGSRLLLKFNNLESKLVQRRLRQWFSDDGIAPDRVSFEGASAVPEYVKHYSKIDIALDPFPYTGGTTTMDALWMGVPVISLSGRLAVSSCGATLLSAVGLPVAQTPEQYISLAAQFAKAIVASPEIRCRIRDAISKSSLMDQPGLIYALENAYRDMWRTWCVKQNEENHSHTQV